VLRGVGGARRLATDGAELGGELLSGEARLKSVSVGADKT